MTVFLIDVYLYFIHTTSLNILEEPLASGRPSRVKFIGAVTSTKFPLCEAFQGRVTIPGQWDGLYHCDTGHLLVHYYDVDARLGRKYVLTNAYTQYLYLYMINVTNTIDASTIAPGLTNRVKGMFWEMVVAKVILLCHVCCKMSLICGFRQITKICRVLILEPTA